MVLDSTNNTPHTATLRVTARADVTSAGAVTCTVVTDDPSSTFTRTATPLTPAGLVSITFAVDAKTGSQGTVTLTCTGQAMTKALTLQAVQPAAVN